MASLAGRSRSALRTGNFHQSVPIRRADIRLRQLTYSRQCLNKDSERQRPSKGTSADEKPPQNANNTQAAPQAASTSPGDASSSSRRGATPGSNTSRPTSGVAWRASVLQQLRDLVRKKRSDLEPRLKEQLAALGRRWNEYSGYEEVVEAKAQVLAAEVELKELRDHQKIMRQEYVTAVSRRGSSQRTLNELLARKATWSEADLATYTDLLKSEHSDARSEREATERYEDIGNRVNKAWDNVVKKTLERYHLEQVWSDRVRAGSTYGSLVVAGINVVIFAMALLIFEPYKRRKLAKTFETRLLQGEEQNTAMLASVVEQLEARIEDMQAQNARIDTALELLLRQAGVSRQILEQYGLQGDVEPDSPTEPTTPPPATAPTPPAPVAPRQQTINDRRREMGMAAAVGFAVGAGLLAAFGALQS